MLIRAVDGREIVSSLLIALDHLRRSDLCHFRIEPCPAPCLALMEKVIASVKLGPDRLEAIALCGRQPVTVARCLPELLLFPGELIDPVEHRSIVHHSLMFQSNWITGFTVSASVPINRFVPSSNFSSPWSTGAEAPAVRSR